MKVLVTGSCGYKVPSWSLNFWRPDTRFVLSTFSGSATSCGRIQILKSRARDVRNPDEIDLDGIDAIIHLSSVANDPCGDLDPKLTWEISCLATMQLADAAHRRGIKRFIYASSGSVYGVKDEEQVTEDLTLLPISEYNKTKMCGERIVLSYKTTWSFRSSGRPRSAGSRRACASMSRSTC